jgi:Protein of unknown function (DUF3533)
VRPLSVFLRYPRLYMLIHTCSFAVVNVSVCVLPPVLLPGVYRYGYATPFYHIQQTIRSVVFGTRNQSASPLSTHLTVQRESDAGVVDVTQ